MKKTESMRDALTSWPTYEYVKHHEAAGWRIAAVEWQREVDADAPEEVPTPSGLTEEIPYGTRIASDCLHLQENPTERQILNHLAEMVVQDLSYAHMAESLNQRGFHTREGKSWTALAVFKRDSRFGQRIANLVAGGKVLFGPNIGPQFDQKLH